jgi:hypothetical protein
MGSSSSTSTTALPESDSSREDVNSALWRSSAATTTRHAAVDQRCGGSRNGTA